IDSVSDKYSAFYPLGVILAQIGLIFGLIFGAEKVYNQKDHHHHHHHHGNHNHHTNINTHTPHSHSHTHLTHDSAARGGPGGGGGGPNTLPRGVPSGGYGGESVGTVQQNSYCVDPSAVHPRMNINVNTLNSMGGVGGGGGGGGGTNSLSRMPTMPPISLLHMNDSSPNGRNPHQNNSLLFSSKGKI
ncbi:uncharacterized protein LOC142355936, partial [Convolutriloba macropyga]|uniref:uncharacterized protein LOC142355936 n=1 Tax=Convolutriloba macropyga TaxID=536237 RepID=UPI003F5260BB